MKARPIHFIHLVSLFITIITCGCVLHPQVPAPGSRQAPVFLPPTMAPTPVDTPIPTPAPAKTAASGSCTNQLSFLSDLSIPDQTEVSPSSTLDKRWEVENSGTCNWDSRYQLRLVAGPELGAKTAQTLFPARSGSHATISIQFTAPAEPGAYRSAWQAFDPDGQAFGDTFFIDFIVK
jgi:hypothetical protein